MSEMQIAVVAILVFLAAWLRYVPHQLAKGLGVDHWYWKLYVRRSRAQGRLPPELPEYVLDQHQWYPPVLPLLLRGLPWALSEAGSRLFPIVTDVLRLLLLLGTVGWITGGSVWAVATAGVVYATTPILISYNIQLNPRGIGALLLDCAVILFLWSQTVGTQQRWPLLLVLVIAGAVLLTHKMTTQLLWFMIIWAAAITKSWTLLLMVPLTMGVAFLMSGGFYRRVLAAHVDIVAFWQRNWRWLQVDSVRESPLYGNAGYVSPGKFYQPGLRGALRHGRYLIAYNPWAWLLPVVAVVPGRTLDSVENHAALWSSCVLALAIATLAVPTLRCLGSGYLYLYNSAFPVALTWSLLGLETTGGAGLFALGFTLSMVSVASFYGQLKQRNDVMDGGLAQALAFLREAPRGTVWCLPLQPSDLVAYHAEQPVLYGGHGYGFRSLERIFPRIVAPVREICRDHDVRYILTTEGYLPKELESELPLDETMAFGKYCVHALARSVESRQAGLRVSTA